MSPDGRLKLVLGKPDEVRMGFGGWTEVRLFEEGTERTRRHSALLEARKLANQRASAGPVATATEASAQTRRPRQRSPF